MYTQAQVSTWERQERRREAGALLPLKARIPSWMHLPVRSARKPLPFACLLCVTGVQTLPLSRNVGLLSNGLISMAKRALSLQTLGTSASQTSLEGFDNDG